MSSKPVFTGTYEQWQRLPQTERVYFTPPPKTTPSTKTQTQQPAQPQKTAQQVTGYSEETLEGASTTQEYATPSSTPITAPLPTSYWRLGTEVPGSQPYVSGKDAPPAAQAPPGYIISKVEMKEVVKEGPGSRVPFEQQVMQVTFKPEPKPLSASATALVGLKVFEDIVLAKSGLQKNEMARTLIQYGPLGEAYFAVGSTAAIESNIYGTAGLVGSVVKSVQERKLQWASGFEWIKPEWKAPQMASTIVSATVSGIMGQPQEGEQMQKLPATYAFGSAFGEVGWGLVTYYGTAYAVKGVKSAASFAYEQSGLKYSHAAYKFSEGWDELLGRVYTSPQYQVASEEVANLKQAFSSVGEKISGSPLYQKFVGGYEEMGQGVAKTQAITKSVGIETGPNIPTASKEAFETITTKTPKMYGDVFMGFTEKTTLVEKETAESIRLIPKMQAGFDLDAWTSVPKTVWYGKSFEPIAKATQVAKVQQTFMGQLGAAGAWAARAGYIKEEWFTKPKLVEQPQNMGELSFNRTPYSSGYDLPLAFKRPSFPDIGTVKPETYPMPVEQPIDYAEPWATTSERIVGESSKATQFTQLAKPITEANIEKATTTLRNISYVPIASSSKAQVINPFLAYAGKPYYPQTQRDAEELEDIYSVYPASGLRHPQAPTQPQPPLLRNVTAVTEFADVGTRARDASDLFQVPTVMPALAQSPYHYQPPRYDIPESTIPKTPEPTTPLLDIPKPPSTPPWNPPSGFKFESFGFDRYAYPRFGLYTSRKKRYPILSPEKFLGM